MRDNYDFSDSTPNPYTKMKTTPALPDEVTQETMQSTDIKTKTKVIVLALQELINKNKVAALKSYKGKVDLDMDIDSLRKRNTQDRLF